jgi:hypothetical protein
MTRRSDVLPAEVLIGGIPYPVREVKDLTSDEGKSLFGFISYTYTEIRVEEDLSDTAKWATLWHEIVHGILDNAGLKNNETLVTALGAGLAGVINSKANPELIKRLK